MPVVFKYFMIIALCNSIQAKRMAQVTLRSYNATSQKLRGTVEEVQGFHAMLGPHDVCKDDETNQEEVLKRYDYKINKLVNASKKFKETPVVDLISFFDVQKRLKKFDSCFGATAKPWVGGMSELQERIKEFPKTVAKVFTNLMHKMKHDNLLKVLLPVKVKQMPSCEFSPEALITALVEHPGTLFADKSKKDAMLSLLFGDGCNATMFVAKSKGLFTKKAIRTVYDLIVGWTDGTISNDDLKGVVQSAKEVEQEESKQLVKVLVDVGLRDGINRLEEEEDEEDQEIEEDEEVVEPDAADPPIFPAVHGSFSGIAGSTGGSSGSISGIQGNPDEVSSSLVSEAQFQGAEDDIDVPSSLFQRAADDTNLLPSLLEFRSAIEDLAKAWQQGYDGATLLQDVAKPKKKKDAYQVVLQGGGKTKLFVVKFLTLLKTSGKDQWDGKPAKVADPFKDQWDAVRVKQTLKHSQLTRVALDSVVLKGDGKIKLTVLMFLKGGKPAKVVDPSTDHWDAVKVEQTVMRSQVKRVEKRMFLYETVEEYTWIREKWENRVKAKEAAGTATQKDYKNLQEAKNMEEKAIERHWRKTAQGRFFYHSHKMAHTIRTIMAVLILTWLPIVILLMAIGPTLFPLLLGLR